jgi:hypothetical protein
MAKHAPLLIGLGGFVVLTGLCGCVSSAQKDMVQKWFATYYLVERDREARVAPVPADVLPAKIGEPDYIVKGSALAAVVPNEKFRHSIVTLSALNLAGLTVENEPPQSAVDRIMGLSLWFYDEAARYPLPSEPASFWGMGTGFQVIWFVVSDEREVVAQGSTGSAVPIAPSHRRK